MPYFSFGPLSNRPPEYRNQYTLVQNTDGCIRFADANRLTPVLPPELLSEIFVHCLPVDNKFRLPLKPNPTDAPLLLCAVCRLWRNTCLRTPRLWSSLFLEANSAYSASGQDYVEFCRRWISRAGSTPVSIYLEAFVACDTIHSLLTLIGGLSQQWQNIDLVLGDDLPKSLSLPADGQFPFLEALSISPPLSELPISFCGAPKLRDVFIFQYTPQIQLPWHQLKAFRTFDITNFTFLEILCQTPNLVKGMFVITDYGLPPLPGTVVLVQALQDLKLGRTRWDHAADPLRMAILDCLTAPALKSLVLSFTDGMGVIQDPSPFLSFVTRSSFQLHTLALSLMPVTTNTLIQCLKATPSVVELKLEPRHFSVNINTMLSQFTGHPDFLPKLESLFILLPKLGVAGVTTDGAAPTTGSIVVQMLRWRSSGVGSARLKSFELIHAYPADVFQSYITAHPDFRRLWMKGMTLCIEERSESWHEDSFMS
ncbi:hypothetical protein MVEN_02020200 [Mycena venus]|uniref:F-box domain-containing protein n=1 Tax=Mycena venus TaxID=2733690 RepID=A0A8H6XCF9_9AGAR|nr:hypothetical protein MVEN_02020200 [Mycena venus]